MPDALGSFRIVVQDLLPPCSKTQMGLNEWGADFPSASDFFLPVLGCRSFKPTPSLPPDPLTRTAAPGAQATARPIG